MTKSAGFFLMNLLPVVILVVIRFDPSPFGTFILIMAFIFNTYTLN